MAKEGERMSTRESLAGDSLGVLEGNQEGRSRRDFEGRGGVEGTSELRVR